MKILMHIDIRHDPAAVRIVLQIIDHTIDLIKREPLPAPKFWLNPEVKDFYEFTPDDVRLDGYETHPQIKNIPIAV